MNLYGYTREMLEEYFLHIGAKKFHAVQVFEWLYQKRVFSFPEMTNIKKELRIQLEQVFSLFLPSYLEGSVSFPVRPCMEEDSLECISNMNYSFFRIKQFNN